MIATLITSFITLIIGLLWGRAWANRDCLYRAKLTRDSIRCSTSDVALAKWVGADKVVQALTGKQEWDK